MTTPTTNHQWPKPDRDSRPRIGDINTVFDAIDTDLKTEETTRANAVTAEATARANADTAEATARANADTAAIASAVASSAAYTDAQLKGLAFKTPVRAVMTTNVTLASPGATFDTVTFSNSGTDDLLLAGQTDATQNGLYVWNGASSALTRRLDASTTAQVKPGMLVIVAEGSSSNRDKVWELQTDAPIVLGTTALTFGLASGSTTGLALQSALDAEVTRATAAEAALQLVFNVKSYGATGNGTTDDTTAIQNAKAALVTAGGGILYFPAGTYYCNPSTTQIIVQWNVTDPPFVIRGAGRFLTTIKTTNKAPCLIQSVAATGTFNSVDVEDLTVDANNVTNANNGGVFGVVIEWAAYNSLKAFRCRRVDTINLGTLTTANSRRSVNLTFYSAAVLGSSTSIVITDVLVDDCVFGRSGGGGNYGVCVQGFAATNTTDYASWFGQSWLLNCYFDNVVINNVRWDSGSVPTQASANDGGSGFMVGGHGYGRRLRINNCVSRNSIDDGIEVGPFTDAVVSGCTVENSWWENILLTSLGTCPDPKAISVKVVDCKIGFTQDIGNTISGQNGIISKMQGKVVISDSDIYGTTNAITIAGGYSNATVNNVNVDHNVNFVYPSDSFGFYLYSLILQGEGRGKINIDGYHVRNSALYNLNSKASPQLYERSIVFQNLAAHQVNIRNYTYDGREATFTGGTFSTRSVVGLFFDPSGSQPSWDNKDTFGTASFLTNRYVYETGAKTDIVVASGTGTTTNTTNEIRTIAVNVGAAEQQPSIDACVSIKATPGTTITGHKTGTVIKRTASTTYLEGYVYDDGTNSYLCLDKVAAGTRTSLLGTIVGGANTVTSITSPPAYTSDRGVQLASRIANATNYWVRTKIIDNVVTADYFTAAPGLPTTVGTSTATATLTSTNRQTYCDPVAGWSGFSWVAQDAAAKIDDFMSQRMSILQLQVRDVVMRTSKDLSGVSVRGLTWIASYGAYLRTAGFDVDGLKMAGIDSSNATAATALSSLTNMSPYDGKLKMTNVDLLPAQSTITAPGTGVVYTNKDGYPELVSWSGGTMTTPYAEISTDGGTTFVQLQGTSVAGAIVMQPNDQIRWTYSSAPTFKKNPVR